MSDRAARISSVARGGSRYKRAVVKVRAVHAAELFAFNVAGWRQAMADVMASSEMYRQVFLTWRPGVRGLV